MGKGPASCGRASSGPRIRGSWFNSLSFITTTLPTKSEIQSRELKGSHEVIQCKPPAIRHLGALTLNAHPALAWTLSPRRASCLLWQSLLSLHSSATKVFLLFPKLPATQPSYSACRAPWDTSVPLSWNRALFMAMIETTTIIVPSSLEKFLLLLPIQLLPYGPLEATAKIPPLLSYSDSIFTFIMALVPHENTVQYAQ